MNLFLAILGVVAVCAGIGVAIAMKNKKTNILIGIGVAVAGLAAVAYSCMVSVPAGHTGVVTTFGNVENYTLEAGLHYVMPWQEVVKMDNRVQKNTLDMSCFSSDIQEVSLSYTINYQIRKTDAMTIFRTIGENYYDVVIEPCISESVKVVTAHYTAESLISDRSRMAQEIEDELVVKLAAYNIELVGTSIENMDFTDAFEAAVEEKQVAEQNRLRAQTEADQRVIEAEADAHIQQINADAYAYEVTTRAAAEAEANRKIAESLTDPLINYTYASRWNGQMPFVTDGNTLIDMGNMMEMAENANPSTNPTTNSPAEP